MDRTHLTNEIASARTELQRLRDERARLQPGDRDGGTRYRQMITRAGDDMADLEAELVEFDTTESSTVRKAERAQGRAAAAAAIDIAGDLALWKTLQSQLADARKTAAALAQRGRQAAEHATAAIRAHSVADATEGSRGGLVLPPAAGSDSGTVEALAVSLKELIESCPGGFRLTSEWLSPNNYAFSRATPGPRPTLIEARTSAVGALRQRLGTLCHEPAPVDGTQPADDEHRADARLVRGTFGRHAA